MSAYSGWLRKRNDAGKWQNRWFALELSPHGGRIRYFASESDSEPRGTIDVDAVEDVVATAPPKGGAAEAFFFEIRCMKRVYVLSAARSAEGRAWCTMVHQAKQQLAQAEQRIEVQLPRQSADERIGLALLEARGDGVIRVVNLAEDGLAVSKLCRGDRLSAINGHAPTTVEMAYGMLNAAPLQPTLTLSIVRRHPMHSTIPPVFEPPMLGEHQSTSDCLSDVDTSTTHGVGGTMHHEQLNEQHSHRAGAPDGAESAQPQVGSQPPAGGEPLYHQQGIQRTQL